MRIKIRGVKDRADNGADKEVLGVVIAYRDGNYIKSYAVYDPKLSVCNMWAVAEIWRDCVKAAYKSLRPHGRCDHAHEQDISLRDDAHE